MRRNRLAERFATGREREQVRLLFFSNKGVLWGGLATGLLLFAVAPLQRVSERIADRVMPGVKPVHQMSRDEKASFYRRQILFAWADGRITSDERQMLDFARESLDLSRKGAEALEREIAEVWSAQRTRHTAAPSA